MNENDINNVIEKEEYHVFSNGRSTVCMITLKNGHGVIGESHCINIADFNQKTGEIEARKNAKEKIWPMEAYLLQEREFWKDHPTRISLLSPL